MNRCGGWGFGFKSFRTFFSSSWEELKFRNRIGLLGSGAEGQKARNGLDQENTKAGREPIGSSAPLSLRPVPLPFWFLVFKFNLSSSSFPAFPIQRSFTHRLCTSAYARSATGSTAPIGPQRRDRGTLRFPSPGADASASCRRGEAQPRFAPRPAKMRIHVCPLHRPRIRGRRRCARCPGARGL